ncbi:hypothetical protein CLV81_0284 [Flagellimonas meridianipacifica]|uniref:Uncharacterized protein n=2 Tax=Flagellimonas meridianipacifica TaxID=1080225 RepID=A0A2T0MFD3_9FLAO|nr:hypothetical protein CLV81_0284 [Allomuricauda pacifica]
MRTGIVIITLFLVFSCNDDDDSFEPPTFDSPEIELSIDSGSFRIGQTIRVTAEYEASALFREFVVQRGNSIIERITYPERTEGEDDFTFEFLITDDLLGTTQTFTFTVTDSLGESESATFTATVSEVEPAFAFEDVEINGTTFRQVTGRINFDETFDRDNLWLLNGEVEVDDITTLTIEEGTTVYALDENTELNVQIGGTLLAEGTREEPIIFTSINAAPNQPEDPDNGDWIGVVLRGDDTPDGNSGILRYVRIENGGNGDEALQLRQVGGATTIDFVQIHNADDTGIRMRGGFVNLKHIFVTKPDDRGVRYSDGWEGNGQFWVIVTDVDDSEGILGRDTDESPRNSDAIMSNVTVIGPLLVGDGAGDTDGVQIRDGGQGEFHNFIVTGFDDSFRNRSDDGDMIIRNSAVFGNGQAGDEDGLHSSIDDEYLDPVNQNSVDEITLTDTFIGVSTTNSSDASTLGDFFEAVNFVGAVSPDDDWTLGWTINFDGTPRE